MATTMMFLLPKAKVESKPQPKPEAPKPTTQEAVAGNQADDADGGTWDFLAGMLGIGGKKAKSTEEAASVQEPATASQDQTPQAQTAAPTAASKEPQTPVDALFSPADDELELFGWGDDESAEEAESNLKSKNSHLRPVKTMTTIRQTIGLGADGVPFAKVATTMRSVRALRVQEVGKATTTIRSHEMVDEIVAVVADVVGIETRKIEIIAMIVGLETMSPLLHT